MSDRPTIYRHTYTTEVVEVPEGFEACSTCDGAGMLSKYEQGWSSLMHSPALAAKEECIICRGVGYIRSVDL